MHSGFLGILGGFGLPCIGTTAQLLALKTVLGILDDVGGTRKTTRLVFSRPAAQSAGPPSTGKFVSERGAYTALL
ncbi:hypothetical protein MRX96_036386 [Rhipicephalus microplus]